MSTLTEFIISALSSRQMLFISAMLFYFYAFRFSLKILRNIRPHAQRILIILGLLNSTVLLIVSHITSTPASVTTKVMVPLLIVLELLVVSRDNLWCYMQLYASGVLNLLCVHGFAGTTVGLWMRDFSVLGSLEHRYTLFSISLLMGCLTYLGLLHSRNISVDTLSGIMHSKSRGMLLLCYFAVSSVVLLISAQAMQPLVYNDDLPRHIETSMYIDVALKDGLILGCSFLIIMVQLWQEQNSQSFQKERNYRTSQQKKALLTYCANITKNQLEAGREYFSDELLSHDDYLEIIKEFILRCVHKSGWHILLNLGDPSYFNDRLATQPSYDIRMRVSLQKFLEATHLPEPVQEQLRASDKEWLWIEFGITVTRDTATGDILTYVALTDVDDAVAREAALHEAATTDPLTGLLNRAAFGETLARSMSSDDARGTLFILDMDHFKEVNDTLGHPAGDALLKDTAALLREVFRTGDHICRMGGDEFSVYAPGLTDRNRILQLGEQLSSRGRLCHNDSSGNQIHTSFSIGIACCPDQGRTVQELYKNADAALYKAKEAGRDTFKIFSDDMAED